MKKTYFFITILIAVLTFWGCNNSGSSPREENFDRDTSYALGLSIGAELKETMEMSGIFPNFNQFFSGFKAGITGGRSRFDIYEAQGKLDAAFSSFTEERNLEAIQKENEFLAENSRKPGIRITPTGLQYEVVIEIAGPKPSAGDMVLVHYEGTMIDGTLFDTTYFGDPATIPLDVVFPGWAEGLQLMSVGSTYKFYIPSDLAYGQFGSGPIPPYSPLIFTVELIDILSWE